MKTYLTIFFTLITCFAVIAQRNQAKWSITMKTETAYSIAGWDASGNASVLTVPLTFTNTTTSTNNTNTLLSLFRKTSNNMANGFGSRLGFSIQDNTSSAYTIAAIGALRNGADDQGDFVVYTQTTAGSLTERLRVPYYGGLKFTSGTLLGTAAAANMEYNGNYYLTPYTATRMAIGGAILDDYTDHANTGTSETFLYTNALPVLANNGEKFKAEYAGKTVDATATVRIRLYLDDSGSVDLGDTGAVTISNTGAWSAELLIIRTSNTTMRIISRIFLDGVVYSKETNGTGFSPIDTFAKTLKVSATAGGAGGGSNDITGAIASVFYYPAVN